MGWLLRNGWVSLAPQVGPRSRPAPPTARSSRTCCTLPSAGRSALAPAAERCIWNVGATLPRFGCCTGSSGEGCPAARALLGARRRLMVDASHGTGCRLAATDGQCGSRSGRPWRLIAAAGQWTLLLCPACLRAASAPHAHACMVVLQCVPRVCLLCVPRTCLQRPCVDSPRTHGTGSSVGSRGPGCSGAVGGSVCTVAGAANFGQISIFFFFEDTHKRYFEFLPSARPELTAILGLA